MSVTCCLRTLILGCCIVVSSVLPAASTWSCLAWSLLSHRLPQSCDVWTITGPCHASLSILYCISLLLIPVNARYVTPSSLTVFCTVILLSLGPVSQEVSPSLRPFSSRNISECSISCNVVSCLSTIALMLSNQHFHGQVVLSFPCNH